MGRAEDILVGLIALGLAPWIVWTIVRGLRSGRLPIGRGHVARDERRGAFAVLLTLYAVALALSVLIASDLLFGLRPLR